MSERLYECQRILKDTGSMYLHCDHHAVHYLKVEMDRIFVKDANEYYPSSLSYDQIFFTAALL